MEIKTTCSFTMCSFDFVCSELNFFDRCARSPRDFRNQRAVAKRRLGTISSERRLLSQIQASAKQSQTFESCLSGALEDAFLFQTNQFVRRTSSKHFHFVRGIRKEQSCSISSGRVAGTGLWQVCDWSWKNHRSAERRERTDARPERPA